MFRECPQSFVLETVKCVNLDIQRCIAHISFTAAQFHKVDHLQTGHVLIIHDTTGAYVMTTSNCMFLDAPTTIAGPIVRWWRKGMSQRHWCD